MPYPQVAGTYSGWITISVEDSSFGPDHGIDQPYTVVITQDGRTITYAGTKDGCPWTNFTRPIGDDGHVQRLGLPKTQTNDTCGTIRFTLFRIWFTPQRLHYELDAQTDHCGLMRWRARLPKVS